MPDSGLWELRGTWRSLIPYGAIAVVLLTGPTLADVLDDRGLPGALIVLALLAIAAVASGYAVYTTLPSKRRTRAMSRVAASLGFPFSRYLTLPAGAEALPFARLLPAGTGIIESGFTGERAGRELAVFSRSVTLDDYEATDWRSCAAIRMPIEAPFLRIEHPHIGSLGYGLRQHRFESERFDRGWHIETTDDRFAVALIDQRMMAWLMTIGHFAFETGGSWVMAETTGEDVAALDELLGILDGFVERIPRALLSLYAVN